MSKHELLDLEPPPEGKTRFCAFPLTEDAKKKQPLGFTGDYVRLENFLRYKFEREAVPGQYSICIANYYSARYDTVCVAYKRA